MTGSATGDVALSDAYREALVHRSHELVALGYRRLDPGDLADLDETAITGKLCDAMEAALDATDRPPWATLLTVVDDQVESVGGKTGKRRPRTDVCVRCINPRPSQRFRFEAKRLNRAAALDVYLGDDGMLALVTGHYGDLPHAGMLGYVQTDSCARWCDSIREAIRGTPSKYHAAVPVGFEKLGLTICEPVFLSRHEHGQPVTTRSIAHTLLHCM